MYLYFFMEGRNLAIVLFLIGCYQRYKSETLHSKNPDWKSIGELFSGKDGCFLALPPKETINNRI